MILYHMTIFQSSFLGFVQGITEFLPISSSGHLFLVEKFFGLENNLAFEIWLHVASLLAVILFFHKKIFVLCSDTIQVVLNFCFKCDKKILQKNQKSKIQNFFNFLFHKINLFIRLVSAPLRTLIYKKNNIAQKKLLGLKLLVSTFFTAIIAIFFQPILEFYLSIKIVASTLIFTGIVIFISSKFQIKKNTEFSWVLSILLGIVQGFTITPGISRSGITISFLIFYGIPAKKSAEISFLLSIPTILGALIFSLQKTEENIFNLIFFSGFVVSFIVAFFSIFFMYRVVERKWVYFSGYCFFVGIMLLCFE